MDCFYASIEIRDNPHLKGKPLVVAGGIVTTASYEARKFGIHSAMPTAKAKKLCPNLIVLPVNKEKYAKISSEIQELILRLTNKVEFIAFDEGYADITNIIKKYPSKEYFANRFRNGIKKQTGLTCSVGIGYNMLSAKIGSTINKPGGQFIFENENDFMEYIKDQNIKKLPGVGSKLYKELLKDGIEKVSQIYSFSLSELRSRYGNSRGNLLYSYSRGVDYSEVDYDRRSHSIGNESTFRYPLESELEIQRELEDLFNYAYERLEKKDILCKTVIIKVKFSNFETITRSKTTDIPTNSKAKLKEMLEDLNDEIEYKRPVRLLGVSFGNLSEKSSRQLTLLNTF
jgi:DNA polymerase-4